MADSAADDFYDDEQTIGKIDRDVDGSADMPAGQPGDPSMSIYTPEKNTTPLDDRGPIDELEQADSSSSPQSDDSGDDTDDALLDERPSDNDPDSYHPGDVNPADEQDGTES